MDGDMSDVFQKLNTILDDPNMSNNLKNILNNFSSSNNPNTEVHNLKNESDGTYNINQSYTTNFHNEKNNTSNTESSKKNSNIPEFDINTILKIKSIMDSLNNGENDSRSNLLLSLKPYLSEHKKDKIDQYVKFLHFAKVIEILNPMGGDTNNHE